MTTSHDPLATLLSRTRDAGIHVPGEVLADLAVNGSRGVREQVAALTSDPALLAELLDDSSTLVQVEALANPHLDDDRLAAALLRPHDRQSYYGEQSAVWRSRASDDQILAVLKRQVGEVKNGNWEVSRAVLAGRPQCALFLAGKAPLSHLIRLVAAARDADLDLDPLRQVIAARLRGYHSPIDRAGADVKAADGEGRALLRACVHLGITTPQAEPSSADPLLRWWNTPTDGAHRNKDFAGLLAKDFAPFLTGRHLAALLEDQNRLTLELRKALSANVAVPLSLRVRFLEKSGTTANSLGALLVELPSHPDADPGLVRRVVRLRVDALQPGPAVSQEMIDALIAIDQVWPGLVPAALAESTPGQQKRILATGTCPDSWVWVCSPDAVFAVLPDLTQVWQELQGALVTPGHWLVFSSLAAAGSLGLRECLELAHDTLAVGTRSQDVEIADYPETGNPSGDGDVAEPPSSTASTRVLLDRPAARSSAAARGVHQ